MLGAEQREGTARAKGKNLHGRSQELQSSLIRFGITLTAILYLLVSNWLGDLSGDLAHYTWTSAIFVIIFLLLFLSVLIRRVWPARVYIALVVDIAATTAFHLIDGQAISAFSLLYVLAVVSYGARYGRRHLLYALAGSVVAYTSVAIANNLVATQPAETAYFLIFLLVLPVYQYIVITGRIAAEQSSKVKSQFLSTMTHELRTPLSGVIGMSRLLETSRLDREQRDYVRAIRSASDDLMLLIGDILDFSKLEAKKLVVEKADFNIRTCVEQVCKSLSARAAEKGLELVCRIADGVPEILNSDELRVRQVLYNLIGNAIKFTETGEVEVKVRRAVNRDRAAQMLQFDVRDTGCGIAEDQQQRIFEGFWQADVSPTRSAGGTGLGTTVARKLCRALGGDVCVTSAVGVGSIFSALIPIDRNVDLPHVSAERAFANHRFLLLERNPCARAAVSDTLTSFGAEVVYESTSEPGRGIDAILVGDSHTDPEHLNSAVARISQARGGGLPVLVLGYANRSYRPDLKCWDLVQKPCAESELSEALSGLLRGGRTQKPEVTSPEAPTARARARGLVAEDNPINAKVVKALLSKSGHEVILVDNGVAARAALSQRHFDLALLDVRMPGMTGIEVTRCLRTGQAKSGRHLPIVALTASATLDVRDACLSAGMDDFLMKPVDPDRLDRLVGQFASVL